MQSILVFLCGRPDTASHHSSEVDSLFHPTTQGEFKQCLVISDWSCQNNDIHRYFLGLNWKVLRFVRGSWKLVISDVCGIANSAT